MKDGTSILQVSPTGYSKKSVIGGGEKYVLYVDHALRRATAKMQIPVKTSILVLDGEAGKVISDHGIDCRSLSGRAWDPFSINACDLTEELSRSDIIYVHQCLSHVGLFVAAHAKLLGKVVIGADSGGGEYQLIKSNPDIARIYTGFHAYSRFGQNSFSEFEIPVHLVYGPVDTDVYDCTQGGKRDPKMLLALGRILPHKGFERIIDVLPPSLSLTIVGTPYDEAYVAFLKEKAAGKNVTFREDLNDAELRALIKRAGLFVHASTHFDYQGRYHHKPELLGLAPLEALSTGLRTLVSDAGSLSELADLPGCWCFRNAAEFANLLQAYSAGTLDDPSPEEMHAGVTGKYGLLQFGEKLLKVMGGLLTVRILLISNIFPPGFIGGYELGALDVARGLQKCGHEVLVLTSDYYPDDENQMQDVPAERVLQCTEPSRALVGERTNIQRGLCVNSHNLRMLVRSILRFSPDRVLCFNLVGLGVLGIIRYLVSIGLPPTVYLMDDIFFALRHAPEARQRFLHIFGNLNFLDAADYIVMSENLAKQVDATLGITLSRKFIVPGWFHAGVGEDNQLWSEPKPNHVTRFVFASRIAAHKGIDLALQAARGVLEQGRTDFTLDVFGSGDVARLLQGVTAYGVGTHVQYKGCPEKEELGIRLREYDAMLFPTHEREPFGFIVSEAAWARCVPVMTSGIGASEWFLDNVDSLKISRTVPDLTAAMLKLLSMPAPERDRMQRRAQKTAADHLEFDRAMNTIQKIVALQRREQAVPSREVRTEELAIEVLDDMWRRVNRV